MSRPPFFRFIGYRSLSNSYRSDLHFIGHIFNISVSSHEIGHWAPFSPANYIILTEIYMMVTFTAWHQVTLIKKAINRRSKYES